MNKFILWVLALLCSVWVQSFIMSLSPPLWTVIPAITTFAVINIFFVYMAIKAKKV